LPLPKNSRPRYNVRVKISSVIFLSALFCLTNLAFADGTYQKTQDGKTLIWNNHPEPGDRASWSGGRDENRYASGRGTLTWFHTEKKIVTGSNLPLPKYTAIASYTGEMVHGKLNGEITAVDANGKKFYGKYVDGRRKNWIAGVPKETAPNEPAARRGELVEAPAEGPDEAAAEETKPSEKIAQKPAAEAAASAAPAAKKPNEYDDSLRSLVGPPTSLRIDSKNAPARSTSPAKSSSTPGALEISTGVSPPPAASVAPSP
jgi:hypothetical protein